MGMKKKNIFVFVVCGDNVHINTVNFSLKYLKYFSKNDIIVVTDTVRNTCRINHNAVVDIKTPSHFSPHQASIWLKTSLHKILDIQHNYCYLDSDVIALSPEVDRIFEHQYGPITFAKDHLTISAFSPFAVQCKCKEKNDQEAIRPLELIELFRNHDNTLLQCPQLKQKFNQLEKLILRFKNNAISDPILIEKKNTLDNLIVEFEGNKLQDPAIIKKKQELDKIISELNFFTKFRRRFFCIVNRIHRKLFGFSNRSWNGKVFFTIAENIRWNEKEDYWCDSEGNLLYDKKLHDFNEFFRLNGGFLWDNNKKQWLDNNGNVLFDQKIHDFDIFFEINGGFKWDKIQERWYDKDGNLLYNDKAQQFFSKKTSDYTDCISDEKKQIWYTKNGSNIFDLYCYHLIEEIDKKFDIKILDTDWRHWNGGVFLFSDNSHAFMDTWHRYSIEIFNDPFWITRDQGTLAATAWKYGLQGQQTLPVKYNCIIDYHCPEMVWEGGFDFTLKNKLKVSNPHFIHIYHEFGRKDWNVWQEIENILN